MANDNIAGVAQGVLANIVTSAVCAAAALFGIIHTRDVADPQNWPVWVIFVIAFGGIGFVGTTANAARLWWKRHTIQAGTGKRLTVILADIVGDTRQRALKNNVRDSLRYYLGPRIEIITYPTILAVGEGRDDIELLKTHAQAQKILSKKRGDVLIWGRVKSARSLALQFTVRSAYTSEVASYVLERGLDLPKEFDLDFGAAIAGRVFDLANALLERELMRKDVLVSNAKQLAQKLRPFVDHPKASWSPQSRGIVFHAFAVATMLASGDEAEPKSLEEAVGAYRQALQEWTREREPFYWAMATANLAGALLALASQQGNEPRFLRAALLLYHDALKEWTFQKAPYHWAMANKNLASVLRHLGARERERALLEEALATCRLALTVVTSEQLPVWWTLIQLELSEIFEEISDQNGEIEPVEQAISAMREALTVITRRKHGLLWAEIQEALGRLLRRAGERQSDLKRLGEAVAAHRQALKEFTRRRMTNAWAIAQGNLGGALRSIGSLEFERAVLLDSSEQDGQRRTSKGARRLHSSAILHLSSAVQAQCKALKEITRERRPLQWAMLLNNLSDTARLLSACLPGERLYLDKAADAARAALKERTRERVPLDWARTQVNLGNALLALSYYPESAVQAVEAVVAYQAALEELTRERVPFEWAITQFNIGNSLWNLGIHKESTSILERAVDAYNLALQEATVSAAPHYHAVITRSLALVVAQIDKWQADTDGKQ